VQFELKDAASALQSLDQAVIALEPHSKPPARGVEWRARLTEALQARAWILRSMNETALAKKADTERRVLWDGQPADELANLALAQAAQAALMNYGRVSADGERSRAAKIDLDLAATNLKLAIANGFTDVPMLRSRPESPTLLEHHDVAPLLMDVAFPAWPFDNQR
jgi:hypothetical protein